MIAKPSVSTVLHLEAIDSTSDEARRLLVEGPSPPALPLPFVVWADRQTRGRGRSRRQWWSDEGSLTFTVALDPAVHALRTDHEPRLALTAALAILDSLDSLGLRVPGIGVRWPNDVEVGDRKLAGLLPEGIDVPEGRRILIGVGLNLATRFQDAPPEISRMAASLASMGLDVEAAGGFRGILDLILEKLETLIGRLAEDDPVLVERWNQIDLLRGHPVRIDLGSRIVVGMGRGIGADGSLQIAPDDGGPLLSLLGGQVLRDRPLV